jgi:K+-sensing histidine kinase KdpD
MWHVDLGRRHSGNPATEQTLKESIHDEAERLDRLVASLLDMKRPE